MRGMRVLKSLLRGKVRYNEELSPHTTFRIGGRADVWVEPENLEDLRQVLKFCRRSKKRIYIIGNGSNLLVNNGILKGVVVSLSNPNFRSINARGNRLKTGAGAKLRHVLDICVKEKLSGLEFLSGIPGTMGGAIIMNASGIGDFVEKIIAMDRNGRIRSFNKKDLKFGYRTSSIKDSIILEIELVLKKARRDSIKKLLKMNLEKKRRRQDLSRPSAGCIFKNPCDGFVSAGKLIELAGLKGTRIGDAKVSEKNANYIVNLGRAKYRDVRELMAVIKNKVKKEFNIELAPEIKIWE